MYNKAGGWDITNKVNELQKNFCKKLISQKIDWSDGATPAGTARVSRPRRSEGLSSEEARAGPAESVPGTEINFLQLSKKHHFSPVRKWCFLSFVPASFCRMNGLASIWIIIIQIFPDKLFWPLIRLLLQCVDQVCPKYSHPVHKRPHFE